MRIDKAVHSRPELYSKKLDIINRLKDIVFSVMGVKAKVHHQREWIDKKNDELLKKYCSGRKVLEIGCGRGELISDIVNKYKAKGIGVDLSKEMISYAKKKNKGPRYVYGSAARLNFKDKSFDVIVAKYLLHHIPSELLSKSISEMKRVCDGEIIVYESCLFEKGILKWLSYLYWKILDGGSVYKSFNGWKDSFGLKMVDGIRGKGLVRYGCLVFKK